MLTIASVMVLPISPHLSTPLITQYLSTNHHPAHEVNVMISSSSNFLSDHIHLPQHHLPPCSILNPNFKNIHPPCHNRINWNHQMNCPRSQLIFNCHHSPL